MAGLIFVFSVGCASVSGEKADSSSTQEGDEHNAELELSAEKNTAISPEVLYLLMTAEIAGQRNQYGVALEGYLQAAKQVDDARVSERAAKIGLFIKDTEKTDEAVSLWLKQDEKNLTARKIAVLSALRNADNKVAVEHLNVILQEDLAGFETTLMELAKVLEKDGKPEVVFSVLEDVAAQHPDQSVIFFVQALLAGQLNKLDLANEKINKTLQLEPDWNKARILRAQLAVQAGNFELARTDLETVLEKTPENVRVKKMLAQVFIKTEAFDDALRLYQDILKNEADDGESQFAIAMIHLQQQHYDQALVYLKELVNKPAWDAQASFYIGRIEFKKEHYDLALVWFDKITRGPYHYDAAMAAVSVLLNQKDFVAAESRLAGLVEKFPNKQTAIHLLSAEVYNGQKKHQKAFDILSELLKQNPEHRDALYTRALVSEKLDRLDVLEADLQRIILKSPDDASALNALGYTLVDRTERYEEAEGYLQRAIKLQPDEAVIIDSLGWLYFKRGDAEAALKYLRVAYQKQPESEIAAHLAEVLWGLGGREEAKSIFEQAIEKSPDDEYLLKFKHKFLLGE